jgi:eukaryotic-like serine/threonine-protein kinase
MLLAPGTRVGPYQILASLGAGGMGEVYRARDSRLDRSVAVKILTSSRGATLEELERFQREARAIARVSHPNICTVYDVGQEDGVPFLVMELLDGETLADRLSRGPIPIDTALAIAIQIAEALDELHSKDVVHRDLKPSNVMLTAGGVKLLDFGLAKLRDGEYEDTAGKPTKSLHLTNQGTVLGTLPYMAPEQVEGRPADARTDTFALGVVLYEMITGRAPFGGTSQASLTAAILTHEPPPLSSRIPSTPASLDRVVKKCLAKDPGERWQSAKDLASALRWSADDSTARHPATAPAASRGRHRTVTALAAVATAAAVIAAAVWAAGSGRTGGAASAPTPRFIPVTFRAGSLTAARFTPDGDSIVYSAAWGVDPYALFMTRRDSVESRRLDIRDAKLLGVSSSGELAFLSGPHRALGLLSRRGGTLVRVSITGGGPRELLDDVIAADWKPGGSELAVVRRGQVEFPLGTKIHGQHRFRHVRVAPDGQRLALVEDPGFDAEGKFLAAAIVLLDRSGRKTTLSSGWGSLTSLTWSPSGDEVWFTANREEDLTTSALRAVSTDGRERVIFPSASSLLSIHDVFSTGRVLLSSTVARMGCSCLAPGDTQPRDLGWLDGPAPEALSSDGRTILMAETRRGSGAAGSIYLRGTDGSDAVRLGDGYPEDLSPDGKWVLAAPVGTRTHWFLLPTGTGLPRTLPPGPLVERHEANFLPDGRRIVFGGRQKDHAPQIFVQDIESGLVRAISPEATGTNAVATPDGRFVIGTTMGAKRFLFPVDGGAPVPFSIMGSDDTELQWSSDGRFLYVRSFVTWPTVVDRIEISTGRREAWKTIQPADPAGVDIIVRIKVTPDGKAYCHDYTRFLSELFVVEGLR